MKKIFSLYVDKLTHLSGDAQLFVKYNYEPCLSVNYLYSLLTNTSTAQNIRNHGERAGPLSSMVQKEEPCFPSQNHLHAWQCTIWCCKECLCIIGCYEHKRRETHGVAPILPWPQPYWEPLEHPQAKDLWGWEAVHTQTAALGGYSDILQRNAQKNPKFNGCKNCEAAVK